MSRRERGQVTFLGLGLALGLLVVGGFSTELWRVLSARRELAEAADAAAAAGANALDTAAYRRTGVLALDPERAVTLAAHSLAAQHLDVAARVTVLDADATTVVVGLEGEVPLTLLRLLGGGRPVAVAVTAEAVPVRGP